MRHLAVDVDGTLTLPDGSAALGADVFDALRDWNDEVVVATGKVLPNALSVPRYVGLPLNVVAENGGVVYAADTLEIQADDAAAREFEHDYVDRHGTMGWGEDDLVNRWRETERCVAPDHPREQVEDVADDHGLEVVYTGYAYHVKTPDVDKGKGLETAAELMEVDVDDFVAVGDSENDVSVFEAVGHAYAVANADEDARAAADEVTAAAYYEGFLEAVERASGLDAE